MIITRTAHELRAALQPARVSGQRIGLVPTMGAFHAGHLHLMQTAREECDVTVVSLFVNPTQFGEQTDLVNYPRDAERDESLAQSAGVNVLFTPSVLEMYPAGFDTVVHVGGSTEPLEGTARGHAHFQGVATVVAKLFNIVQPHAAYFGQKDAQQTVVVRQLVRDLNMAVELVVCPTVREPDGLAMSSRNARLSVEARQQASALSESLALIAEHVANGERSTAVLLESARKHLRSRGIDDKDVEYYAAVDSITLHSVSHVRPVDAARSQTLVGNDAHTPPESSAPTLFVLAVRVGGVRLIDNALIGAGTSPPHGAIQDAVVETTPERHDR